MQPLTRTPLRTSRSPKTIAATRPCEAATETCTARRPLRMLGDSSTAPAASSSLTRFDTVAALSPVDPGDLDLGQRPVLAHGVEHPQAVHLAEGRLRARGRTR